MKEHEELLTRLEKLRREAKGIEMAGLQEELARKAKIAEKEIERAKLSNNGGSSFRSISPVGTPDDNLTKVPGWLDKTEEAENVASFIYVPSVHRQTYDPTPVITVQATHGTQCSAQVRDLKPSVNPGTSTEAANRGFGVDRTKTVIGAGSQKVTAQPEAKFATSKTLMTLMANQSLLPPTDGGNPSSPFDVPQFANTQN